jgi:glycosyltransferase involved in cell wall biosynthesis
MRRILILIKGLQPGGTERLLADMAPHLDRTRATYELAFLVRQHDDVDGELERAGLRVHFLDGARGAGWIRRLRQLVRERRFGLVHSHSPYAAAGARIGLAGLRPRVAHVYTEHNLWRAYHPATRLANAVTFPRNDHVFAVSETARRSILAPMRGAHVETLLHGFVAGPPTDRAAARAELGLAPDAPVVGTVAGFRPEKAHRDLLDAAALVRERVPEARFVLVGDGPLEDALRAQARRLGIEDTVAFAGYRPDARRLAGAFDVFTLSSLQEGLPIALLEAMACGVPVVATAVGGVPEAVRDGREGLLVAPGRPPALADALVTLLEDPARRAALGAAAQARTRDFDLVAAVRRMESVYAELLP